MSIVKYIINDHKCGENMLWNSPNSIAEKILMFHSSRVIHFAVKQVMIAIENTSVQDGAPKIAFSYL